MQSLFCWKVVCNAGDGQGRILTPPVAVLVLLEGRMQHGQSRKLREHPRRLQSLFCWKVVCNSTRCHGSRSATWPCCNPCFAGRSYATSSASSRQTGVSWICSPCFAGRSYATVRGPACRMPGCCVAVLVLLEGRMQRNWIGSTSATAWS